VTSLLATYYRTKYRTSVNVERKCGDLHGPIGDEML